jgi:anti-sigma factor RsiW
LPEAEAAEVRAHLASCAACEEERRLLEEGRAVVPKVTDIEPSPWFAAKVAARAAEARPRPVGAPWWRWAFPGFAFVAVAGAALVIVPQVRGPQAPRDDMMVLAQRLDLFEDLGILQNQEALEDFEVVEVLHTLQPQGRP